ncbi:MAG TPA: DUF5667 domain-containing protein, partial [Candidatus Binatia bacterium]|nr:DUF5667 domain-containing protein [Candidatus Binatia bacterium]
AEAAAAPREPLSWLPRLRLPRAVFAAGFAAVLTVATGAAVLAAPPGSPFFNARLAIEQALLPPVGDLDARLAAHQELLEDRLAEAQAAAARGDTAGLTAALAAYDAEVAQAVNELGTDADGLAHLEAMLAKHVVVLTDLEAKVPSQASVERALENSQKAIEKIKEKKGGGKPADPGNRPSPPAGAPSGVPTGPGGRP